jgi:hypothetical protein
MYFLRYLLKWIPGTNIQMIHQKVSLAAVESSVIALLLANVAISSNIIGMV